MQTIDGCDRVGGGSISIPMFALNLLCVDLLSAGESLYRVCIQARFCAAMRSLADVVYFMLTRRLAFIICKLAVNLHAGEPEYTHKFNLYVKWITIPNTHLLHPFYSSIHQTSEFNPLLLLLLLDAWKDCFYVYLPLPDHTSSSFSVCFKPISVAWSLFLSLDKFTSNIARTWAVAIILCLGYVIFQLLTSPLCLFLLLCRQVCSIDMIIFRPFETKRSYGKISSCALEVSLAVLYLLLRRCMQKHCCFVQDLIQLWHHHGIGINFLIRLS